MFQGLKFRVFALYVWVLCPFAVPQIAFYPPMRVPNIVSTDAGLLNLVDLG